MHLLIFFLVFRQLKERVIEINRVCALFYIYNIYMHVCMYSIYLQFVCQFGLG